MAGNPQAQEYGYLQLPNVVINFQQRESSVDHMFVVKYIPDLRIGEAAAEHKTFVQLVGSAQRDLIAEAGVLAGFADSPQGEKLIGIRFGGKLLIGVEGTEEEFGLEAVAVGCTAAGGRRVCSLVGVFSFYALSLLHL